MHACDIILDDSRNKSFVTIGVLYTLHTRMRRISFVPISYFTPVKLLRYR